MPQIRHIQHAVYENFTTVQARMKQWVLFEKKLQKRVENVQRQCEGIKKLVSQNHQAEIELKNDLEALCEAMAKHVQLRIDASDPKLPRMHKRNSSLPSLRLPQAAEYRGKRQETDPNSPLRIGMRKERRRSPIQRSSRRSGGSVGVSSPMGS